MFEKEEFSSWFKENTPKEGLSENTTFTRQFLIDAWDNGYINGYNKANEWHYVKDGALPKFNEGTEIKFLKGRFMKAKQIVICFCEDDDLEKVIAWKEIVLPELKE